jgi:hypothetical protein
MQFSGVLWVAPSGAAPHRCEEQSAGLPHFWFPGRVSVRARAALALAWDEQHERRLLVGGRLHRRADADELSWVVDAGTCFRDATRTSPG